MPEYSTEYPGKVYTIYRINIIIQSLTVGRSGFVPRTQIVNV